MTKVVAVAAAVVGGLLFVVKVLPLILGLVLSIIFPPLFFLLVIALIVGGIWLWLKSRDEERA